MPSEYRRYVFFAAADSPTRSSAEPIREADVEGSVLAS